MTSITFLVLAIAGYCSATVLIDEETVLVKGNQIFTLPTLEKEYMVSFEIKTTGWNKDWTSILHVTTKGNHGVYGYRSPAFFFKNRLMVFCSPINGNANQCVRVPSPPLGKWVKFHACQKLVNGKYVHEVFIDGKQVNKEVNRKPQVFQDLEVYTSDPWYAAHKGSIRRLKIQNFGFNSTFSLAGEDVPRRNNVVTKITTVSKQYEVSFDFYPTVFATSWTSVLHLSSGDVNPSRIPGVFFSSGRSDAKILSFIRQGKQTAHICSSVNGNRNYCYQSPYIIKLNQWNSFVIKQKLCFENVYIYSIEINGHVLLALQNNKPMEFPNAFVYVGDKWYDPQMGVMRNLRINQN